MGNVDIESCYAGVGAEGTWNSLYLPLNFAVNLKTTLKKKVLITLVFFPLYPQIIICKTSQI